MYFRDILRNVNWMPAAAVFGGRALLLLVICAVVIVWMTIRELRKR